MKTLSPQLIDPEICKGYSSFVLQRYRSLVPSPPELEPRPDLKKLGIIVPYRKREEHLADFVPHMRDFFDSQEIEVKICIVNQVDDLLFARSVLCNIGFQHLQSSCDYVAFHDVDMLPLDADYRCMNAPVRVIDNGYPKDYFSGVVVTPNELFARVNGFSNRYWHWGWEDVDLRDRFYLAGIPLYRQGDSSFRILPHANSIQRDEKGHYRRNRLKLALLNKQRRTNRKCYDQFAKGQWDPAQDGLSDLRFHLENVKQFDGYTRLDVDLEAQWSWYKNEIQVPKRPLWLQTLDYLKDLAKGQKQKVR